MRMPPNQRTLIVPKPRSRSFNGGRHAHAAESGTRGADPARTTRFNGGRHAHAAEFVYCDPPYVRTSGFNGGRHAHAAECRPPAENEVLAAASMEGGMRMPPNWTCTRSW